MHIPATIIVNPYCHQGKGWSRWLRIRERVMDQLPGSTILVLEKGTNPGTAFDAGAGKRFLVSAGGDGSIHHLLNALMREGREMLDRVTLGAIGLGSSNDFLKPVRSQIGGIATRINAHETISHDVGELTYIGKDGEACTRYFLINASMGATAFGNHLFNDPGPVLAFLKRQCVPAASLFAALQAILQFRNIHGEVRWKGTKLVKDITNINIIKLPYVSGGFHYRQPIEPDDGKLFLNICHSMDLAARLRSLYALSRGRLKEGKHVVAVPVRELSIATAEPEVFECDGETFMSPQVHIRIIPGILNISKN